MEFIKKGKVEFIFEKNSELPLCVKFKNIYFTITGNLAITNQDVIKELGGEMPASKIHCSILAEEAIRAAVDNYYKKRDRKEGEADVDDEE